MATDRLENITTNEVKAYFGIDALQTDSDARIDVIRPLIVDYIKSYCRNDFAQDPRLGESPFIDFDFTTSFFLNNYPIVSVQNFTQNGIPLVNNVDYRIFKDTGRIDKIIGSWPKTANNILIDYTGGQDLLLAQDVVLAFYELVGARSDIKTKTFVTNEGIEASVTMTSTPKYIFDILDKYKRRHLYEAG